MHLSISQQALEVPYNFGRSVVPHFLQILLEWYTRSEIGGTFILI